MSVACGSLFFAWSIVTVLDGSICLLVSYWPLALARIDASARTAVQPAHHRVAHSRSATLLARLSHRDAPVPHAGLAHS